MRIQSVHIRNFRKLKNCHIDFGERETVFVGANNSGKILPLVLLFGSLKILKNSHLRNLQPLIGH